jgi:hypothetical protein
MVTLDPRVVKVKSLAGVRGMFSTAPHERAVFSLKASSLPPQRIKGRRELLHERRIYCMYALSHGRSDSHCACPCPNTGDRVASLF